MMEACRHNKISRSRAFTLLELIGVLTIISLLLAAAAPLTIDIIRSQRQAGDDAYLPVIADALKRGVLREQLFPLDDAALPGPADTSAWWRLAERHGGGSEGQIRFPEGSDRPRRLFLAASNWAGKTFYETTGDGSAWLADVSDPAELRMLLLSTTNPDLLLPASLTPAQFEAFWSDWSVGANGNTAIGSLADFGLNVAAWTGRAAELNLERIDLRDLLCRVVIENRRAIVAPEGSRLPNINYGSSQNTWRSRDSLEGFWDLHTPYAYTTNLDRTRIRVLSKTTTEDLNKNGSLDSGEDANNNGALDIERDFDKDGYLDSNEDINGNGLLDPGEDLDGDGKLDRNEDLNGNGKLDEYKLYTYVLGLDLVSRGSLLEDNVPCTIVFSGYDPVEGVGSQTITLSLTERAPMALVNPLSSAVVLTLGGWEVTDVPIQDRYFLKTQELLLGEPWNDNEVGIFIINDNYSTLRFDGLAWSY